MAWAGFIVGDASSPGITEDMGLPALNARRTHRSATHPPPRWDSHSHFRAWDSVRVGAPVHWGARLVNRLTGTGS